MKIEEDGQVIIDLLKVWLTEDKKGVPEYRWEFGEDDYDAYTLLGVLDVIKEELINIIREADNKREEE